ncbi:MAG: 5-oxoprolinase subunit PxpA [Alphaproteobacteria bacterium]|nr:5-oxoprolinase subunit PxpA [Alphaproteobacteria bacterium]
MTRKVNLNADMGEGFGAYDIGNDIGMLEIINSANVACGFHAGDPNVMSRVCRDAKAKGVSIGAHPGFNDLWGFGRRSITMPVADVETMVIYQIGALQAIARANGTTVSHVKIHGALNNMGAVDPDLALSLARAVKAADPSLIFLVPTGSELIAASETLGLAYASEVFADRTYDDNGDLTPRSQPNAMIHDPKEAVDRVLHMIEHQEVISTSGKAIPAKVHSICVHGDEPTAVAVSTAVRDGIRAAGVELAALPDIDLR